MVSDLTPQRTFLHALLIITPAQYSISEGNLGDGFGKSVSVELGLNAHRSTNENTFV